MTIYELAVKYYPKLWDISRLYMLVEYDKITQEELEEIIRKRGDTG